MKKSFCYAYFADGKFIGWYADSFGSVRPYPKVYSGDVEKQTAIIEENLLRKLDTINEMTFDEAKNLPQYKGILALGLARFSDEDLLRGKVIELKIVECPEYDGINPDFDKEIYLDVIEGRKKAMKKFFKKNGRDYDNFPASRERRELVERFDKVYGDGAVNNWIYADPKKVGEWAKNEPVEFIRILKFI